MKKQASAQDRSGISRIEVLFLVVILTVLVGLLLPWIYNLRGSSQRVFCQSRQMIVAKGLFLKSVDTPAFPGYRDIQATIDQRPVETSWVYPILPYLHPLGTELAEEIEMKNGAELSQSDNIDLFRRGPYAELHADHGNQGRLAGKNVGLYLPELVCPDSGKMPSAETSQPLSFVVNCGMPDRQVAGMPADHLANGVFFDHVNGSQRMTLDFLLEHDGLENTLMLSENLDATQIFDAEEFEVGFVWIDSYRDGDAVRDPERLLGINQAAENASSRSARPSSRHPRGVNVAYCDGSTSFLSEEIDYLAFVDFMTTSHQEIRVAGSNDYVAEPYRKLPDNESTAEPGSPKK